MKIRKALKSDSVKDFSSLFFSNVLQKVFGLIREIIIASILSSSLIYAHFLMLQSITGIFSQFTSGNSMRANLLPRVTKIIDKYEKISLHNTDQSLRPIIFWIFLIMQIIQTFVILYLDSEYSIYLFIISFLLSVIVCFNFYTSIYLTILQAQGRFLRYSIATTLNEFFMTLFIYPFLLLFNVLGFVFSRVIGHLSVIYFYIVPIKKQNNGYKLILTKNDFNIPTLILGNFANIIILTSRFVSGSDGSSSITYFTYSIFILNAILTSVISNISTLLLRKFSLNNNNKFMIYSIITSVLIGVILVLGLNIYGKDLIELLFVRGNFKEIDAIRTTDYLNKLSLSFVFIFIATTLFQPFFSLSIEKSRKVRRSISTLFITTIILGLLFSLFMNLPVERESLIIIYSSSIISIILSAYSYIYYLKQNN